MILPTSLAFVDGDDEYAKPLSLLLATRGIAVEKFSTAGDLFLHHAPFSFQFYVVEWTLADMDGESLVKMLRGRSDSGVLVVTGTQGPAVFEHAMMAGADMYLAKPVSPEQVVLAIQAVQRRAGSGVQAPVVWKLDRHARQLIAPDSAVVDLSDADMALMECFVEAKGKVVMRDQLQTRLGHPTEREADNGLNATIYRLRRRIERATPTLVPLQSKSRVGYVFRAALDVL